MKNNSMTAAVRAFRAANPKHRFMAKIISARKPAAPAVGAIAAKEDAEQKVGELYLYDAIGSDWYGGISAKMVVDALKKCEEEGCKALNLFINSPGGDVFEGTAIYNNLARFQGAKTVYVDGLAASAASYIAMVGDKIITAFNAMWMVHNPWGIAIGNASAMRETADLLDKVGSTLVDTYVKRTKLSAEAVKDIMDAETWMTASEAKDKGFTDEVTEEEEQEEGEDDEEQEGETTGASAAILSRYQNTPKNLRPNPGALVRAMQRRMKERASPQK